MTVQARWYVDADTLGLARILVVARADVTFCGDSGQRQRTGRDLPLSPVQATDTPDEQWIPTVTRAGLAIITRDRKILSRKAEIDAVAAAGARMFAITSEDDSSNWGLLEVVVTQWRAMEAAAALPGPFVYQVTRTTCHQIWPHDLT